MHQNNLTRRSFGQTKSGQILTTATTKWCHFPSCDVTVPPPRISRARYCLHCRYNYLSGAVWGTWESCPSAVREIQPFWVDPGEGCVNTVSRSQVHGGTVAWTWCMADGTVIWTWFMAGATVARTMNYGGTGVRTMNYGGTGTNYESATLWQIRAVCSDLERPIDPSEIWICQRKLLTPPKEPFRNRLAVIQGETESSVNMRLCFTLSVWVPIPSEVGVRLCIVYWSKVLQFAILWAV